MASAAVFADGPVVGTERNRNLRGLDYAPMLLDYHRQTVGENRQFFTYPQRNPDFRANFAKTEGGAMAYFADTLGGTRGTDTLGGTRGTDTLGGSRGTDTLGGDVNSSVDNARGANGARVGHTIGIAVSPIGGMDYRGSSAMNDTIWPAFDGGLYLRGYADSLDFDLEARMYAEKHSAGAKKDDRRKPQSYDHEVFDVQNEETGGEDYISYSRYRAHLGLNYAFARLQLARDVLHFGPGYYNNLTLNQFALPYNMLTLDLTFGPLRVFSAYADLRVNSWSYSKDNLNDRNLYAHRYELALGNLTLGMSEIQILYNENKPWLFTPVVPLFIEKGNYTERVNNGGLALDLNYRILGFARVYGEFFLDDMESPYAVYENKMSNNRWAAMAGMQMAHDFYLKAHKLEAGTIAEIARVEPYTYTHYDTAMAQMAHLGLPLGNPNGPNSLAVDWTVYAQFGVGAARSVARSAARSAQGGVIFAALHNKWLWKGDDYGSHMDDPYKTVEKRFIHDAPLAWTIAPALSYQGQYVAYTGELTLGDEKSVFFRVGFKW